MAKLPVRPGRPRRRRPGRPLPRERAPKRLAEPHLQGRKRIRDHLEDTIGMCEALFEEHGLAASVTCVA